MAEYHEPEAELSDAIRDIHRALISLKEEIEAVDWYNQRWAASKDETLRAVLAHNRDEEIEHATMNLEWLRRNVAKWDASLRTYLFTSAPITEVEAADQAGQAPGAAPAPPHPARADGSGSLRIGSLKGGA